MSAAAAARGSRRMRAATSWSRSASGSQLPLDPSVRTRWWIRHPAAAHLARVAPHPNSMSSGWAPTARADAGMAISTVIGPWSSRSPTGSPWPRSASGVPTGAPAGHRAVDAAGGHRHDVPWLVDVLGQVGQVEDPQGEPQPLRFGPVAGERARARRRSGSRCRPGGR